MSRKEYCFIFHKEKCIQCHGCEVACKSWNHLPVGITYRRVLNQWEGTYPKVRCSSLSISCLHCTNPECLAACPTGAISKDSDTGIVSVNPEFCIGCQKCKKACPYQVPQFSSDKLMTKCHMCHFTGEDLPPCVRTCPTHALDIKLISVSEKQQLESQTLQEYTIP